MDLRICYLTKKAFKRLLWKSNLTNKSKLDLTRQLWVIISYSPFQLKQQCYQGYRLRGCNCTYVFLQEYCVFYTVSQMEFNSVFNFADFQKKLSSKNVPNFYGLNCFEGYQKSLLDGPLGCKNPLNSTCFTLKFDNHYHKDYQIYNWS